MSRPSKSVELSRISSGWRPFLEPSDDPEFEFVRKTRSRTVEDNPESSESSDDEEQESSEEERPAKNKAKSLPTSPKTSRKHFTDNGPSYDEASHPVRGPYKKKKVQSTPHKRKASSMLSSSDEPNSDSNSYQTSRKMAKPKKKAKDEAVKAKPKKASAKSASASASSSSSSTTPSTQGKLKKPASDLHTAEPGRPKGSGSNAKHASFSSGSDSDSYLDDHVRRKYKKAAAKLDESSEDDESSDDDDTHTSASSAKAKSPAGRSKKEGSRPSASTLPTSKKNTSNAPPFDARIGFETRYINALKSIPRDSKKRDNLRTAVAVFRALCSENDISLDSVMIMENFTPWLHYRYKRTLVKYHILLSQSEYNALEAAAAEGIKSAMDAITVETPKNPKSTGTSGKQAVSPSAAKLAKQAKKTEAAKKLEERLEAKRLKKLARDGKNDLTRRNPTRRVRDGPLSYSESSEDETASDADDESEKEEVPKRKLHRALKASEPSNKHKNHGKHMHGSSSPNKMDVSEVPMPGKEAFTAEPDFSPLGPKSRTNRMDETHQVGTPSRILRDSALARPSTTHAQEVDRTAEHMNSPHSLPDSHQHSVSPDSRSSYPYTNNYAQSRYSGTHSNGDSTNTSSALALSDASARPKRRRSEDAPNGRDTDEMEPSEPKKSKTTEIPVGLKKSSSSAPPKPANASSLALRAMNPQQQPRAPIQDAQHTAAQRAPTTPYQPFLRPLPSLGAATPHRVIRREGIPWVMSNLELMEVPDPQIGEELDSRWSSAPWIDVQTPHLLVEPFDHPTTGYGIKIGPIAEGTEVDLRFVQKRGAIYVSIVFPQHDYPISFPRQLVQALQEKQPDLYLRVRVPRDVLWDEATALTCGDYKLVRMNKTYYELD